MFRFTRLLLVLAVVLPTGCNSMDDASDDSGASDEPVNGYPSHSAQIFVDGDGEDWAEHSVAYSDRGDGGNLGVERLWIAHSEDYLFLRLEVGNTINLQERNNVTLHLDTDDDPTTGTNTAGIGADVSWTFGERMGEAHGAEVGHAEIGVHSLPTIESSVFEIALDRSARPGGQVFFPGEHFRIAVTSEGDRLPDEQGGVGYELSADGPEIPAPTLERPASSDVRVYSQNTINNFGRDRSAIFDPDRQDIFRRMFDAIGPDVIALQEIYSESADEVASVTAADLGIPEDWEWGKRGPDLVLGSRFPLLDSHTIPGYRSNESGAFLLDARSALGSHLIVIVMHPPCCNHGADDENLSRNAQRQHVVDGVAAFLRDVTADEGPFDVPSGTPIAVVGDMNFVGKAQQPKTLRTGEIVNTGTFGPAGSPDWDASPLLDTNPQQTATPLHVTWSDSTSSFPPGRLDYAYVTDSVVDVVHEFVLNTAAMTDQQLTKYDLRPNDTVTASDHLPVVVDLSLK